MGLAALLGVAVLVVVGIAIFGDGEDSCAVGIPENGQPVSVSESELTCNAAGLGHLAYWVGPQPSTSSYEVTSSADGRIFIRYLTGGASAGDERPDFLTVGTYAVPDALGALRSAKAEDDSQRLSARNGYSLLEGASGLNAYVVFDDEPDLQIEVYSPRAGRAVDLARSGALEPLE